MNLNLVARGDRGPLAGVAAVLLAVSVYLLLGRFDEKWGPGIHLVLAGAAAAAVLVLALRQTEGRFAADQPTGWTSAMLVAGFALSAWALLNLADILGGSKDEPAAGTITWIALLLALAFAAFSMRFDSAICAFLAAVAAVIAVVAAVQWIFEPEEPTTFRWVLLVLAVVLAVAGAAVRDARPRHGTLLIDVAGLSILAIVVTYVGVFFSFSTTINGDNTSTWWELVVLAGGVALAAFSIMSREPGPGYIGALVLAGFVVMAVSSGDEPSIIGWPLVLLLLTAAAFAAAFRPGDEPEQRRDETVHEVRL
jgi:peptidoglycan/LPS O-acetylase OafA/YrhL